MRPNLSVASIAGALAVLGTSAALAACGGGDKPPVNATEVKTTNDNLAKPADGHCGAGKDHAPGQASCGAKDPAAGTSAAATPATGAAAPTTPSAAATTGAPATPAAPTSAAPAATTSAKPATPPAKPPAKSGAQSSCGAGTCSAKK